MARILLGFMGAGKSTLASLLDPDFLDMDALLVEEIGMPIVTYFETFGEEAFRAKESQLLARLLETDRVISTGGGIVVREANRQLLKKNADNIYLKADFETLYQRISSDNANQRPLYLTKTKAELAALFEQREGWYEEVATKIVDVASQTPEQVAEVLG